MASIQLPPWLQIDPIEPARIKVQANAQRNQAAASERQAQAQAQELQFRREQAQVQQAQEAGREAAQERAAVRRDQVLKQTNDRELASAAEQLQLKREVQAEKSQQFEQTLRMKQQQAEQTAKNAASQMQGMQAVQKGLKEGQPLQKLIAENAPLLFSGRADRAVSALQRGAPKNALAPSDFVARQLRDEQGNPLGINAIPGANGSIKPLPRTTVSPEGRLRADQIRLGVISRQMEEENDPAKLAQLTTARDGIMSRLEQMTAGGGALAPAAAAQSDVVRVKSPSGKPGVIPRSQLAEALKSGYEEVAPVPEEEEEETPADEPEER
jgi:hypothetical protein